MATGNGTLQGKVAIITGGGTGLGKMTALLMAKEGADIVVAARRVGAIEQTAKEVRDIGPRALAIPTDVTDPAQVNNLVKRTLAEMGGSGRSLMRTGVSGLIPTSAGPFIAVGRQLSTSLTRGTVKSSMLPPVMV